MASHAMYKKLDTSGPGGRNCPCCGPSPSFRKKHDRIMKHREKRVSIKEASEAMKPE